MNDKPVGTLMSRKSEIILCSRCKGEGKIEHEEMTCYHKREYRYWDELCKQCEGSGRMKTTEEIYRLTIAYSTPSVPPETKK